MTWSVCGSGGTLPASAAACQQGVEGFARNLAHGVLARQWRQMVQSAEPTVSQIAERAEQLARARSEPLAGVHLLAVLGATSGSSRDLLEEGGAGFRRILDQWERLPSRGPEENFQIIIRATQETARRFGQRTATGPHLLLALLSDSSGSVRKVLDGIAADLPGLRSAALQAAQGLPTRRAKLRPPVAPHEQPSARGTAVPVMQRVAMPRPGIRVGAGMPSGRAAGQAVSVFPEVGPVPTPAQRVALRKTSPVPPSAAATGSPASEGVDEDVLCLNAKQFPILTQVGRNLSLLAARGQLDEVVGRDEEIEHALDVLAKRHGNSPCLIGPAGVGKTSVARGIALRLAEGSALHELPQLVIELPISELFAGTGVRGALAARLSALKKEVGASGGRVILFFDEIHQLFAGDAAEEIAADLKLSLAKGELPCIGATSTEEYRRVIEADAALSRRFSAIEIEEPSREEAFLVLAKVAERLSIHHRVHYEEDALALAISWSVRYLPGRALPDKAVAVADLAGARSRRRGRDRVDHEAIAEVIANQAGMPIERLLQSDSERMLALEEILAERVIGHAEQMGRIARILRRNAAGLGGRRPIGTFLLLGPTGVGKTETAKAIAEVLFHSESAMTRLDMAEMSEAHAVARLIGAPPGYIGHDAGGQLTEAVRRRPYQVILLDEIEKAHPDVLTAFLAVFDEGRMTDSRGRLVDFTNTVILLTSNLGASLVSDARRKRVGFQSEGAVPEPQLLRLVEAARAALSPELYNRIDEVLAFAPLSRADVARIGRKLVLALADELELARGVTLSVDDAAIELLLDSGGYEPELGARPLRRTMARLVEVPLAEALLSGALKAKCGYSVTALGGVLRAEIRSPSRAIAAE